MNLRDLCDAINVAGPLFAEVAAPNGGTYYIELQKRDLLAQMRGRYAVDGKPNYKSETGMTVDASVPTCRYLKVDAEAMNGWVDAVDMTAALDKVDQVKAEAKAPKAPKAKKADEPKVAEVPAGFKKVEPGNALAALERARARAAKAKEAKEAMAELAKAQQEMLEEQEAAKQDEVEELSFV
jgi:hypothetical protein